MKNLSNAERRGVVEFILKATTEDQIPHGTFANAATKFECSRWTITRIWRRYQISKATTNIYGDVDSFKKARSGRKGYDLDEIFTKNPCTTVLQTSQDPND